MKQFSESIDEADLRGATAEVASGLDLLAFAYFSVEPILSELRGMGIRIALDDFGSGYCGLHYLRQFTIDNRCLLERMHAG
ncbi:EAL domain-containing protein [Mesorhizobium caraganae]|uniref:EAL domain-containing protein n=1 Tax=Mesorhizobium caraganae TaxID=483206 RepID=UPI0028AD92DC|nr:EAL domain-containing protein [Mesorhizobium caraganae]